MPNAFFSVCVVRVFVSEPEAAAVPSNWAILCVWCEREKERLDFIECSINRITNGKVQTQH